MPQLPSEQKFYAQLPLELPGIGHIFSTIKSEFLFSQGSLQKQLREAIQEEMPIGLFIVNIRAFSLFESLYGAEAAEQVLTRLEELLRGTIEEVISESRFVFIEKVDRASLAVLFQDGPMNLTLLMDRALALRVAVRHQLNQEVVHLTGQKLKLEVGCSLVPPEPKDDLRGRLYRALYDAQQVAEGVLDAKRLSLMAEFRKLIDKPLLFSVYQPLVDLRNGNILGWEALARGPQEGYFSSPKAMFDFAEEVGTLFQLERACREQALKGLGRIAPGQKLFLNIHPQTLGDPDFRAGETRRLLQQYGLNPASVVFEITERHSIKDFSLFHRTLDHYRSQGFKVAIDDVGTGYSGLNRIARLRPDYIKADMGLVRGVDANPVQRALLETLVTFTDKIGCGIIAEGIETATELSSLVSMGVHFGQGYYLAKPALPKPQLRVKLPLNPEPAKAVPANWKCSIPVRELVEPAPMVSAKTKVRKVKKILDSHPISGLVVVENKRPVGLLMSHSLDRQLGTLYGTALYYDREVSLVMDPHPLIVESSTPVEAVAAKSTTRDRFKLYDHIIVTSNQAALGVVSVQKMLDALARVQVEMAKGANPLTGLPGGVALEQEIERCCALNLPFSLIYVDLDNFKIFNDGFGFEAGDKMLRLLADILQWACRRHGMGQAFVGHIGGDDFVVITTPDRADRLCTGVVRCFERLVRGLYRPRDIKRGFVLAKGRDGRLDQFPLVSVSLGIVDCVGKGCDLALIAKRAAEVKRFAKSKPGHIFVHDRRLPLGLE